MAYLRGVSGSSMPSFLVDLFESLTMRGRSILHGASKLPTAGNDLEATASHLLSRRGEASGVALATALVNGYRQASSNERMRFLEALRDRFGPDEIRSRAALERLSTDQSSQAIEAFHLASEPLRQELFRRLNLAPGGTAALVAMREELLNLLPTHPSLASVDVDIVHLLTSWFNRGFLLMRPLDWTTPAHILEKIIRYEAVHEIHGWDDLRNRLKPTDRRCYGFFHPQLVDEPIIFVEVALTSAPPASIAPLLDVDREPISEDAARCAVFYSISNTQTGLRGVNFGNFLIKQVVENLKAELPHIKSYVTLSPVPGFAAWLAKRQEEPVTDCEEIDLLKDPDWSQTDHCRDRVKPVLMRKAAEYFLSAKDSRGRPIDPVARFHLGNGARLERLCFLGDPSPKGMRQSYGLMVNYQYELAEIEDNHEAFAEHGHIAASTAVRALLSTLEPTF